MPLLSFIGEEPDTKTDHVLWSNLYYSFNQREVPNSTLATVPSRHVRSFGPERHVSSTSRSVAVWSPPDEETDRAVLVGTSRCALYHWRSDICFPNTREMVSRQI